MYIIFNNKEDRNRRLPFNRVYVRLACRTFASSVCHKFDLFKQNSFVKEENASDYRCMLTMKKFLSFALVAVMLVAAVSVIAFAEAPKAADFTANNGFFIYEGKANQTDVQDPATLTDTAQGLQIVHGGYYTSGDNCGGVVSTNKYDLNGFEATIYFETAPEVTTDTDCWVAVDFLAAPRGFYTNNFNLEGDNPGNQGILDLIRFGKPYLEIYNGVADFSQVYNSQSVDATVNEMFAIKSGTTITVKVARNENGTYQLTFAREGFEDFVVPYEFPVQDVFPDGKAHFSVIASCEIAPEDGWTYYITDLKNGVEMTAEEIAAIEEAKAAAELAAKTEEYKKETDRAMEKANEAMEEAQATGDEAAIARAQEAVDAANASYAAIDVQNWEEAQTQSDLARDYAKEAGDLSKAAQEAAEPADGDNNTTDTGNQGTEDNQQSQDTASSGGVSPVLWIVIAIVVIVVIVVIAVVAKKKK